MAVISILGPTASGKSELALLVAEKLNGEIISCDSMQVYKGMDIGTAKPSSQELAAIPHHLVSCFDISVRYSASHFCEFATKLIKEIQQRGNVPIISGGTGLYARLLLYGHDMPLANKELLEELKTRLKNEGREKLVQELHAKDPLTCERVKDNNRRLVRALEIIALTGKPVPQKMSWGDEAILPGLQVINLCTAELNRSRIEKRTKKMLQQGWIEETKNLIQQGLWETPTACQSLGYKQIGEYLDGGFATLAALEEKLITLTCQYAKKQRTWFRNQHPGAEVLSRTENDSPEQIADKIVENFHKKFL